ncbi:MAG: hypothetical protein H6719_32000 [Sandaracinaceae bacterium]|nr:hypothetical protein [Sandaracinaceae bacterium]
MQLANERTRLHLDGVRSPITADVTRRRVDGVVVTQPLPFLRLDTTVTERGRRSRIRRVAIAMDGDMPRLLLELCHDGDPAPLDEAHLDALVDDVLEESAAEHDTARSDDTLDSFTPGVSTRPARTDSTVPYEFAGREETKPPIVISDPPPPAEPAPVVASTAIAVRAEPRSFVARSLLRLWRRIAVALAELTAPASS